MSTLYMFLIEENFLDKSEQAKVSAWENNLKKITNRLNGEKKLKYCFSDEC